MFPTVYKIFSFSRVFTKGIRKEENFILSAYLLWFLFGEKPQDKLS